MHAGEEGHARPGWTTSRREQALAHTVPDDLRHITTHLYCWIQSTKKARDEAKDEEVDNSSKNGANRCPTDGSIVQLANCLARVIAITVPTASHRREYRQRDRIKTRREVVVCLGPGTHARTDGQHENIMPPARL